MQIRARARAAAALATAAAFSLTPVLAQNRTGPRPPHGDWTNSLKPRGVCGPQLTLAENGSARYAILLPAAPTTQDEKAAADLAKYLSRITGAKFAAGREDAVDSAPELFISIGRTAALQTAAPPEADADLGRDGYGIAVRDENLYLFGGSRRGAISAVYALLEEDLGCRWYDASEPNVMLPDLPTLSFQPVPRTYVPQLEVMRWILVWETKSVPFSLWNRSMDCDMNHKFPSEWGGIDTPSGIHSLPDMIPADKYFEEHPEYFSMIDGKRNPVMICPSNPDVLEMLTQQSRDMVFHAADNPVPAHECPVHKEDNIQNNVALTPRDGPTYCQCPDCQALIDREGTPGAPLLNLVNKVADAVGKTHPDKRIWFLAYQSTAKPPKTLRPRDNVIVWLCSDSHGFGPATLYLTETPRFQEYLRGWEALGAKIVVWEYVTDFGTGMHLSPLPNLTVVGEDIRYLAAHKSVIGILLQGCLWGRGDRGRLRAWIWAKQTWDPSRNTWDLVRDFVYGYYGQAAEPVFRYNTMLRQLWDEWHKSFQPLEKKWGARPPKGDDFVARANARFDEAEALAADDPVLLSRLEDARLPLLFQQVLNGVGRAEDPANPLPADDPYWAAVARLRDYCNRWNTGLQGRYDVLARAEAAGKGDDERSLEQVLDTRFGRVWVQTLPPRWRFATDPDKIGMDTGWYTRDHDDTGWGHVRTDLDSGWQGQGFTDADSDAFGWYRQRTYISDNTNPWRSENWYLYFEAVDEDAYVYLNGKKVFEHSCESTGLKPEQIWETPFLVKINDALKPGANNLFSVGVYNRKMMGGIWKPVHLIACEQELDADAVRELLEP